MHFFLRSCVVFTIFLAACVPSIKTPETTAGPDIRVLLDILKKPGKFHFTGKYYLQSEEARYEFDTRNRSLIVAPQSNGIQIYNENRNLYYRNNFPLILKPADLRNHFIFNKEEYAGTLFFDSVGDSTIYIINVLPLEEYLKGVVPAEIPSLKPEQFQAVKAQAICARTYALRQMNESSKKPYDIQASIADQVYDGFARHTVFADQAVEETRGMILTFNDQPARIYYHSTCGGKIESAAEVWPEKSEPYLRTGTDAVSDMFSCIASPYFRWTETKSIMQLDSAFNRYYGKSVLQNYVRDTLHVEWNMQITGRSASGRVQKLQVNYADTSVILEDYQIRRFLAPSGKMYLPSTLFYLSQSDDSTLVIHGGGSGHGVGMCQYGALNMAQRGFQYYHILAKYFPETLVSRFY
jgi:stage II sporulation protein D